MRLKDLSKDKIKGNLLFFAILAFMASLCIIPVLIEFLPKNSFHITLIKVCRNGTGVPEASGFISNTETHPTAILIDNGGWKRGDTSALGNGWASTSINETQLVFCIGKSVIVDRWCTIDNTMKGILTQLTHVRARDIFLYDAKTGRQLWTGALYEDNLPDCGIHSANIYEIKSTNTYEIRSLLIDLISEFDEP